MTDARVSQVAREALSSGTGALRVSQMVREVLRSQGSAASTYVIVDQVVREVLRSSASVLAAGGRPRICIVM